MPIEIFLSHAHKDEALAKALVGFLTSAVGLESKEIRCTSQILTGLSSGARIADQLREDIRRCRFFMPLLTRRSALSEFVSFEIGAAWVLEKDVIPLIYGLGREKAVPSLLSSFLWRDISKREQLIKLAEDLAGEIFVKSDRPDGSEVDAATAAFLSSVRTGRLRRRHV